MSGSRKAGGNGPAYGGRRCPVSDCTARVAPDRLMCRTDWYQVPKALRDAVWVTWQDGAGAGTAAHQNACKAAIRAAENARQANQR